MSPFSGLGSTHQQLVDRLSNGLVKGYKIQQIHEYKISKNPITRVWRRWFSAPNKVSSIAANYDLTHITDQEQSGLCPKVGKSVITVHDLFHLFPFEKDGVEIGNSNPSFVRKRDLNKILSGIRRSNLLICVSKYTQKECEMRFPGVKTAYVPHAIDLDAYSIKTEKPEWFNKGKNLLIIGSEEDRKRLNFAIDICAEMDLTLHKIGAESSDDSKDKLIKYAEVKNCNLNWVGRLEQSEIIAALQHADALIFPSIAEGFGLPPLEAYASGTVALVADAPAHNEIPLEHHILPPYDIDKWRTAILNLQDESEKVRERATEFSVEKWSERMKSAYDSIF